MTPTESDTFVLDTAEAAEVRKFSNGNPWWAIALNMVFGIANGVLRLVSHGIHDILGWVFLSAYVVLGGMVVAMRYRRFAVNTGPTKMIFDSRGIQVVQDSRAIRTIPYARIARVRILPSVIVVEVRWARPIALARRAVPNSGAPLIRIFEDRLVGKHMLVRQSPTSVIVNTASA
jgi:hypothetical protein